METRYVTVFTRRSNHTIYWANMGLFPPWLQEGLYSPYHKGYYALRDTQFRTSVNYGLRLVQWLGVCLVTGVLWMAFKDLPKTST